MEPWQIEASRVYGGGDYFGQTDFEDVGDTLYTALQRELSLAEGCDSETEARRRIAAMIADLELVLNAI